MKQNKSQGWVNERILAEITFEKPREELVGKQTIWTANIDNQAKSLGYVNTVTVKDPWTPVAQLGCAKRNSPYVLHH